MPLKSSVARWNQAKARDIVAGLIIVALLIVIALLVRGSAGSARLVETAPRELPAEPLKLRGTLGSSSSHNRALAVIGEGKQVLGIGQNNVAQIWNLDTGQEHQRVDTPTFRITCAVASPDGKTFAFGASDGSVWLGSIDAKVKPRQFREQHDDDVTCLGFEPLGAHLFTGGRDRVVRVWDTNTGESVHKPYAHSSIVNCLTVTLDGLFLVTGSHNGEVLVWHAALHEIAHRLRDHESAVVALSTTPDAREAFSISADGAICHWDLEAGLLKEKSQYPLAEDDRVIHATFSHGSTRLLVGTAKKELGLWNTPLAVVERASRELSDVPRHLAILPQALYALAAIGDEPVAVFDLPPPSRQELSRLQEANDLLRKRADQIQAYAKLMTEGADAAEKKDAATAKTRFASAIEVAPQGTLHRVSARQALDRISKAEENGERYKRHMEVGKKAADARDFRTARREFQQAREIFPDRTEASDGLRKLDEADELGGLLSSATVEPTLGFDFDPKGKKLLDVGKSFAYLLVSRDRDPPLGLTSSPLTWRMNLSLRRPLPRDGVKVEVRVTRVSDGKLMGTSRSPLAMGQKSHVLTGSTTPPPEGWKHGEYEFQTLIVVDDRTDDLGKPRRVTMAILNWSEHQIEVTPQAVRRGGFQLRTGIRLEDDSAFRLVVSGKISPARLDFCKELTGDRSLKHPLAVGPEGVPWSTNNRSLALYSIVDHSKPWASLMYHVSTGYTMRWVACQSDGAADSVSLGGELVLSINSVTGQRTKVSLPFVPVKDDRHWLPDCGAFHVKVLVPRFETTTPVPGYVRRMALKRYL